MNVKIYRLDLTTYQPLIRALPYKLYRVIVKQLRLIYIADMSAVVDDFQDSIGVFFDNGFNRRKKHVVLISHEIKGRNG